MGWDQEDDVTPTLSNALAEPEAPTLGRRGRRRGSTGADSREAAKLLIRNGHHARNIRDQASWAGGAQGEERHSQSPERGLRKAVSTSD